ncbi:glutaredoxin [Fluviicoccus keumensis]|uniref:Glutaredoxin n=1 Tax=Fluviicoccus keumensis TaxID=1435465 RepID=A0A4Q7ZCQ0_9GAMM|nr:DUF4124 domain-containing protein [Fluviicoccus keumensis]RZU47659.1 glutaredoxin [Fluviicoccus keumensis]
MRLRGLTGLVMAVWTFPAAADIHKWVDAQGQVHFGDQAPRNARSQVITVTPNVYASPDIDRNPPVISTRGVILYSASWCGVCQRARAYFQSRHMAFTEYDVENSATGRADYVRLQMQGVPVILAGGRRLNGFSPESFEIMMKSPGR